MSVKISEMTCKTALSPSRLPGLDYTLNPYRGCTHACVYCYAPVVLREEREWGRFADVKINMPGVLSNELRKKKKGVVGISTVTDAYQQIEKKYEITKRCLEELLKHDFPICLQTKSSLVLRDLDIIQKFSKKEVGFTITTLKEEARKKYEPFSSSTEEKLSALEQIVSKGIKTWVFLGPIMPYITDSNDELEILIKKLSKIKVESIMADKLRIKPGIWGKVMKFISKDYPELVSKYENLDESYFNNVKYKLIKLCKEHELKCDPLF